MIRIETPCPDCNGKRYLSPKRCSYCGNSGFIKQRLPLTWNNLRKLYSGRIRSLNRSIEAKGGRECLGGFDDHLLYTLKLNEELLKIVEKKIKRLRR